MHGGLQKIPKESLIAVCFSTITVLSFPSANIYFRVHSQIPEHVKEEARNSRKINTIAIFTSLTI